MNNSSDFDRLDELLAQPALIADRGFSTGVELRIGRLNTKRRNVFLLTGLCWLALVILAASPQAIYADLATLAMSLDIGSIYAYAAEQIRSLSGSTAQPPYKALGAAFLSIAAVLSMAVRA